MNMAFPHPIHQPYGSCHQTNLSLSCEAGWEKGGKITPCTSDLKTNTIYLVIYTHVYLSGKAGSLPLIMSKLLLLPPDCICSQTGVAARPLILVKQS